jgi:hypothetical protein
MMDLQLTLDFACCGCDESVSVTVRCQGKGLMGGAVQSVAAVNVPCPTCGQVNQLFFEPSGAVRTVRPYAGARSVPGPSVN